MLAVIRSSAKSVIIEYPNKALIQEKEIATRYQIFPTQNKNNWQFETLKSWKCPADIPPFIYIEIADLT